MKGSIEPTLNKVDVMITCPENKKQFQMYIRVVDV